MKRFIAGTLATFAVLCIQIPAFANDEEIAKQIAQRLRAEQAAAKLKDFNIGVQVENGTVTVMGEVADPSHAMNALEIARRVPGVKLVVNDLFVKTDRGTTQRVDVVTETTTSGQNSIRQVNATEAQPTPAPTPAEPVGSGLTAAPIPVSAAPQGQELRRPPMAFAPATSIAMANRQVARANFNQTAAVPYPTQGLPSGIAQANFDQPQLPGYAWPTYAAHPNYAGVTYPQQYSPTAWPYIGPFYPYPQVPLGWRKVSLEWDDGWWYLDFKSK